MDHRLMGVIGAAVITATAATAAQAPSQQPRPTPQTITGCLQKGNAGAFVLDAGTTRTPAVVQASSDSSGGGKSYALIGVIPPGLKLAEHVSQRVEVTGLIGEPFTKASPLPTLSMQNVKLVGGSCS